MVEELNPNDPAVREARAKAEEYAERVANGEEPWLDEDDGEPAESGFDDDVEDAVDDDVEDETTSDTPEVVEDPAVPDDEDDDSDVV